MRLASQADLDAVRQIIADAYTPYLSQIGILPLPVTTDYGPRIARGEVWLMEADGVAIASAVLERHAQHLAIFSLAILPAHQNRGLGRQLLEFAEQQARDAGLLEVRLYTNARMERNIGIYRRAGYRITGTRPHPLREGWVLVDMAKPVTV